MSIVTYPRFATGDAKPFANAATPRGFWARSLNRLVEARQRRAMQDIRRYHRDLLPRELDEASWKINKETLPFGH
jgi:hypothetical protein